MISLESIFTFVIASVLLALAPGSDNIFVLAQSAIYGPRAGFYVVFGLCTGLIFHSAAVALGVAAIFQTSAVAFTALKTLGAVYLVYLAWKAFRAPTNMVEGNAIEDVKHWSLYRRGIIMNITNPKVSIFFLAFLPQFADPVKGSVALQLLGFGLLFIMSTMVVFGAIALLAGSIGQWLNKSEKAQKILNKSAAVVFLLLALKLAI